MLFLFFVLNPSLPIQLSSLVIFMMKAQIINYFFIFLLISYYQFC